MTQPLLTRRYGALFIQFTFLLCLITFNINYGVHKHDESPFATSAPTVLNNKAKQQPEYWYNVA